MEKETRNNYKMACLESLKSTKASLVPDENGSPDCLTVGCVVMASGASRRFGGGRNKLLEEIGGKAMVLRTVDALSEAGLEPLIVTRSEDVCAAAGGTYACLLHAEPEKSATIRNGLSFLQERYEKSGLSMAGCLFIPGDQPLVRKESICRMLAAFTADPGAVVRLGYGGRGRSPVIFPASMFPELMKLTGEQGGSALLAPSPVASDLTTKRSCGMTEGTEKPPAVCSRIIVTEAKDASELMDADTPEELEKIRMIFRGKEELRR